VKYANTLSVAGRKIHQAFVGAVEQRLADSRVAALICGKYSLYVNPPRPGVAPEAMERLVALIQKDPPEAIVYLSCSASSLARDLKILQRHGYEVKSLQSYDFFPQTEHFETLAILTKN
jgi:tRNA/tmRNA/rRNA uracil-C5-methylase (TrmA/RlmC/RlmD family)